MDILEELEITLDQLNAISLKLTDSIFNWDLDTTCVRITIDNVYISPLIFRITLPVVFGKIWTPPGFLWMVEDGEYKMYISLHSDRVVYFDNYNSRVNRGVIGEYKKDHYVWNTANNIITNDKRNMIHCINKLEKYIVARTNRLICRNDAKEAKYNPKHYVRLGNLNHPDASKPPISMISIPKEDYYTRLVLVERTFQPVRDIYFAPTIDHVIDNFDSIVDQLFTIC